MPGGEQLLGHIVGGRYRIEAYLGSGASSAVYRARHLLIDRKVALKLLRIDPRERGHYRAWFLREARAVNRINHANIADIFDFGETDDGLSYLVMELLTGRRLVDLLDRGRVHPALALDIVEQIASALSRAHDLGVVHRDLKPDHVFLERREGRRARVKLIDFGLAAIRHEARLTAAGAVLGTPAYISPEQARGEDAGPRSDLYSLGVMLFEMVTGRRPFDSKEPETLLECHRSELPPDPRDFCPDLDGDLARLTLRLLAKAPHDRLTDAYHLLDECQTVKRKLPRGRVALTEAEGGASVDPAAGGPRLDRVAAVAIRASLLARMAAATYPGGGGPREVGESVETMWRLVADLSHVEGELHVLARWDENLHSRAREFAERVGREVEELSRSQSLHRREIASASAALVELQERAGMIHGELEELRGHIDGAGDLDDEEMPPRALEVAGALAARHEMTLDSVRRVRDKIARWQHLIVQEEAQRARLQRELERQAGRSERELEAGKPRVSSLVDLRESLLRAIGDAERELIVHFESCGACGELLEEYRSLAPAPDP